MLVVTPVAVVAPAAVVTPGPGVDDAAVVVAQGCGVGVVVPEVVVAVLEQVGAVVAADAGVDADLAVSGQTDVAEAVAVSGLVGEGPALEDHRPAAGVAEGDPFGVQAPVGAVIAA